MADYLLAQSSVLGSMLISPQIVGDVMTNLQPEDFTEPMGQEVFLAIRALHLAGIKNHPECVITHMGRPNPPPPTTPTRWKTKINKIKNKIKKYLFFLFFFLF